MHTPTLCAEEETRKCWGYPHEHGTHVHAHTHPHFVQRRKPGNAGVTPTNMAANLNFQVTHHLARIFFFTLILFNYLFIFDGRGFSLLHMAFLSFW